MMVIDVTVQNDSNIRKNQYEQLEKYQGLKDKLEEMWKVKAKVFPVIVGL